VATAVVVVVLAEEATVTLEVPAASPLGGKQNPTDDRHPAIGCVARCRYAVLAYA